MVMGLPGARVPSHLYTETYGDCDVGWSEQ